MVQVHSGVKSTLESKALDTDSRVRRKEKKKRAKKVNTMVKLKSRNFSNLV